MNEQIKKPFREGVPARATTASSRGWRHRVTGALAVAFISVGLAACGDGDAGKGHGVAVGEAPKEIVLVVRNDLDSFDPMRTAAENGATQMYEAIYDTLIRRDLQTGEYIPAMASSWKVTPTRIDFTVKPDLRCSDGSPLTPTDIANSIKRLADPKTGSVYTGRVFGAGGAKRISADDAANTLTVEVNDPHTDLLDGLRNAFIVCPKGLADTKALATVPQGSGPYKLTSSKRGDTYVLERWDSPALEADAKLPEKITMKVVTADSTRANLFETNAADIVSIVGRDARRLRENSTPVKGKALQADALVFNQRAGFPAENEHLRRALAHAIDSASYTKAASFGIGEPIDTAYTPNLDCYTEANGELKPKFDLDKARAELEAAGYGPGKEKLTLRLVGYDVQNSGPDYIADAIRKIGVDVEVKNGTLGQAAGIIYGEKEPWDIFVFPLITAAPNPYPLVTKMSSNLGEGGSYNFGRVHNADYDALTKKAPGATGEERCRLWSEAEAALLKRTDLVPLMWSIADYFAHGLTFDAEYRTIDLRTIRTTGA
jgi:peptide/nickel transport system substrate-binding protein